MANQFNAEQKARKSAANSVARIEIKTSPEVKSMFERAAQIAGMTLTAFLVSECRPAAEKLISDQRSIFLDDESWNRLNELVSQPAAEPTPDLKDLFGEVNDDIVIKI